MTRREEIEKAANEFYKGDEVSTFVVAAQWADKTMIDKACEWLKYYTNWDDKWDDDMGRNPNYGMIEEFRKAMEE